MVFIYQRWTEHLPSKLASCLVLFQSLKTERKKQPSQLPLIISVLFQSIHVQHCIAAVCKLIFQWSCLYHFSRSPAYSSSWLLAEKFALLIINYCGIYTHESSHRERGTGSNRYGGNYGGTRSRIQSSTHSNVNIGLDKTKLYSYLCYVAAA